MSGSKVIPLLAMLHHALEDELMGAVLTPENTAMLESLRRQITEKLYTLQSMSTISLETLLDPRFKKIGFFSPNKAADVEKMLIYECAAVSQNSCSSAASSAAASSSSSSSAAASSLEPSQLVTQGTYINYNYKIVFSHSQFVNFFR